MRATATAKEISPLAIWRSRGKVNWALFSDRPRAHDQAQVTLDAAFVREVQIANVRIATGWPRRLAAEHAFAALGYTMERYEKSGALDTEPSANVRLALRHILRAPGAFQPREHHR